MIDRRITPREMLEKLIAFDTTSRNSNLELIGFVQGYLAEHGILSRRYDHEPGKKTNLFATIGPQDRGGVALSGHTDVVPVDGQDWTSDPFTVAERDGRLFGRGTADMKSFIAVALAMVPEFQSRDLRIPIHLAFSCDEEIGCRGVKPMIARLVEQGPLPKLVIVGEPTSMQVIDAHKGVLTYITEVTGAEAHSSDPLKGVNAIAVAARLVVELETLAAELRERGDPSGKFAPPYTTLHVGVIAGGTVKNIVPGHCRIVWEIRPLPDADFRFVLQRLDAAARRLETDMQKVSPKARIVTTEVNEVPGLIPEPDSPALRFMMRLAQSNDARAVSYATEAGHFRGGGMPTFICGPGSIEQAHKPDEFIARSEIDRCVDFMRRLGDLCEAEDAL